MSQVLWEGMTKSYLVCCALPKSNVHEGGYPFPSGVGGSVVPIQITECQIIVQYFVDVNTVNSGEPE